MVASGWARASRDGVLRSAAVCHVWCVSLSAAAQITCVRQERLSCFMCLFVKVGFKSL